MIPQELLKLISSGESVTVEFKKSRSEVTKDVYETVCAFSNRDGGHIFLGVKDNGEILGIEVDKLDKSRMSAVAMDAFLTGITIAIFPICVRI